jgi:tRNA U34 2-thiouridine synthase MnmA/TrmU
VLIAEIHFQGDPAKSEADEYVRILNNTSQPVDISNWVLNEDNNELDFFFPDVTLEPGQSCLVYTDEIHEDSCGGTSWLSATPIWDNTQDCGYLFDSNGEQVGDPYCYSGGG